jgi:hypothetical protein
MDQNFRDLIALQQLEATRQLARQAAQQAEPKGAKCPYCGGCVETNYERCKNCTGQLSWIKGHPCKPGQEASLEIQIEASEKRAAEIQQKNLEESEKKKVRSTWVGLALVGFAFLWGYINNPHDAVSSGLFCVLIAGVPFLIVRAAER